MWSREPLVVLELHMHHEEAHSTARCLQDNKGTLRRVPEEL
jgi:hypothetical protein